MIGIVTPFNIHNYGSKLQAYAVQNIINGYAFENEIINYIPTTSNGIKDFLGKLVSPLSWYSLYLRIGAKKNESSKDKINPNAEGVELRRKSIDSFDIRYRLSYTLVGLADLQRYSNKYDAIIVGSDQVWNPVNIPAKFTTLEFAPQSVKRLAFAASFGVSEIHPKFLKRYYRRFLKKYRYITVREKKGVELCKNLIPSIQTTQIPDPTLILDPLIWLKLAETKPGEYCDGKYCFCYFLGENKKHREIVKQYAEQYNMIIVSMVHFKKYNEADSDFADIEIYDASPEKFLSLIMYADAVMTDSFHGTVFSTIFHKEFFTFKRYNSTDKGSANSRIYNLLESIGLDKRLVNNYSDMQSISTIDYITVDEWVKQIRDNAVCVLDKLIQSIGD